MTTVLERSGASAAGRPDSETGRGGRRRKRVTWFAREPAWPLMVVLIGWPFWWALGLQNQVFILAAIPMAVRLTRMRLRRPVKLPPGFGIWMLFMVVVIAGVATLALKAPDTIASPVSNRVLALIYRILDYSAAMTTLLYVGNLRESELPRRKLAGMLGLVGIYAVIGGIAGVVAPSLSFTSPLASILPSTITQGLGQSLNVGTSQVMGFLGFAEGRVKAPFTYTNQWGDCLAILLPWLFVAWRCYGGRLQRKIALPLLLLAVIPVVASLDRGLWVGLLIAAVYLGIRLAGQGKLAVLGVLAGGLAVVAVLVLASPLGTLVTSRLQHGKSNNIRTSLTVIAIRDGLASPIIGYGDTRHMQGSTQSIAVGSSANCRRCGNSSVGGNGQIWLLLITSGFTGVLLYCLFFGYSMWRYRRDRSPYGMAGEMVLLLGFAFMPFYEAAGPPLAFTMMAIALMWRNEQATREEQPAISADADPALLAGRQPGRWSRARVAALARGELAGGPRS